MWYHPPMAPFASRAGEKLDFAFDSFPISVEGLVCADFGSSTGGFVSCLLARGAAKVYSVDTAYGELAWELRQDPRVVVLERTNAVHVTLPEKVSFISIDASWTRQTHILPNALAHLEPEGTIVSLIKPHYEAPRSLIRKGYLPPEHLPNVLDVVTQDISNAGGRVLALVESPITGGKMKNTEYLALIKAAA